MTYKCVLQTKGWKRRPQILCDSDSLEWPELDPILRLLKERYAAEVVSEWQNPIADGAKLELKIGGQIVVVFQSEYGDITVYAEDRSADPLIKQIFVSFESEL